MSDLINICKEKINSILNRITLITCQTHELTNEKIEEGEKAMFDAENIVRKK